MKLRTYAPLLLVLLTACAGQAPAPVPTTATAVVSAPATTIDEATPGAAPVTNPAPTAAQTPDDPWVWVAYQAQIDPVEGYASTNLVDVQTGATWLDVCTGVGLKPFDWSAGGQWLTCVFDFDNTTVTLVNGEDPQVRQEYMIGDQEPALPDHYGPWWEWNSDDSLLAVSTMQGIYLIDPQDQTSRQLKACDTYVCGALLWLPDNQTLITNDATNITSIDVSSGVETAIAPLLEPFEQPDQRLVSLTYLPADNVVFIEQDMWFALDLDTRQVTNMTSAPPLDGALPAQLNAAGCTIALQQTGTQPDPRDFAGPNTLPEIAQYNLFAADPVTGAQTQLTTTGVAIPLDRIDAVQAGALPELQQVFVRPGQRTAPHLEVATPSSAGCAPLRAQYWLRELGYDPGPIDGIYGPNTSAAVSAFQLEHALPITGIVDAATWEALQR